MNDPVEPAGVAHQRAILAREAAEVLRGFYDDVTPCVHRLKSGERCRLCGRARALLVECDAITEEATNG